MPSIKSVDDALAMIKSDKSKILGLTVGTHKVTPGLEIPKAGMYSASVQDQPFWQNIQRPNLHPKFPTMCRQVPT